MWDRRDDEGWALKALRESGQSLLSEFRGFTEDELGWTEQGDAWSLRQTAAHLRDAEELALAQISSFIDGSSGALPFWDIEVLPLERDYQRVDLWKVLAEFRRLRGQSIDLLLYLRAGAWKWSRAHPFRGPLTLGEVVGELARHDLEHLWEVRQLKARFAELREPKERRPDAFT